MTTEIVIAGIALLGSVLSLTIGHYLSKRHEIEVEWKKTKLLYYRALIESFSGALNKGGTSEGDIIHAKAKNDILLFASSEAINKLNTLTIEASKPSFEMKRHNDLLKELIIAIRKDIGLIKDNDFTNIEVGFWAPGKNRPSKKDEQ